MKDVNIMDGDIFTDGLWTNVYEELRVFLGCGNCRMGYSRIRHYA